MLGTTYGHFSVRHSDVLRAVAPETDIDDLVFDMDIFGPSGRLMAVQARSSLEAQDRTAYPPIRGSFAVTAPLHVTRIRLRFGGKVFFDKAQDVRLSPGYQFTIDWFLGTDALPETKYGD